MNALTQYMRPSLSCGSDEKGIGPTDKALALHFHPRDRLHPEIKARGEGRKKECLTFQIGDFSIIQPSQIPFVGLRIGHKGEVLLKAQY